MKIKKKTIQEKSVVTDRKLKQWYIQFTYLYYQ